MPFKKVVDASDCKSEESCLHTRHGLKFDLDSFNITLGLAPSIMQTLVNVKRLQMLSLVDSMLCDESFAIIARGIPQSLLGLNISKNEQLTSHSYSKLHEFSKLRILNLEQNSIDDEKLSYILQIHQDFQWNPIKMFSGQGIGQTLTPEAISALAERNDPKASSLKNMAQDRTVQTLFSMKGLVLSLRVLNVSRNKITDVGVRHLATFMACSRSLQTLLIHWN